MRGYGKIAMAIFDHKMPIIDFSDVKNVQSDF
jgi:hypothetical protein